MDCFQGRGEKNILEGFFTNKEESFVNLKGILNSDNIGKCL